MSQTQLQQLFEAIGDASSILILPHNNPDSDAIASTVALRHLLKEKLKVESYIFYKGIIGRAENKALTRYLDYPLQPLKDSDLQQSGPVALIDTQPGRSNNPAPSKTDIAIVIDHHARYNPSLTSTATFADVRPELGATSTILIEYLRTAGIELPTWLATALFYGVKTSTMGLGRNAHKADTEVYHYLQPQIDVEALAQIETARVPPSYFKSFDATLRTARVYEGVVIAYMGLIEHPDLTAEMADLLLRLEESHWVLCMGVYENAFILSVRTRGQRDRAGQLVQAIIGPNGTAGGHGTMAGGQIPLAGRDPGGLSSQLTARALQHLNISPQVTGKPLI